MTPITVSTDKIPPAERRAFWTEAICRTFANVETRPLGAADVRGRFKFVQMGEARLVRFDSSPQCYSRSARLVSRAGSDEFMFDVQERGRSAMIQAGSEGVIAPGHGVLYDARRPFEDRLFGDEQRAEVLIATVPAALLLRACPDAERLCAMPVPLSGPVARAIAAFIRAAIADAGRVEIDIVACLSALLRLAGGEPHGLGRGELFGLIDVYLDANIAAVVPAASLAAKFGIAERTLHRIFSDRDTTFERHALSLRVRRFHSLLAETSRFGVPIAGIAMQCGFADAAHATRTFRTVFGLTPRDFRKQSAAENRLAR